MEALNYSRDADKVIVFALADLTSITIVLKSKE